MQYQLGLFQDQTAWQHRCIFHLSFLHQSNLHLQEYPFSGIHLLDRLGRIFNALNGQWIPEPCHYTTFDNWYVHMLLMEMHDLFLWL